MGAQCDIVNKIMDNDKCDWGDGKGSRDTPWTMNTEGVGANFVQMVVMGFVWSALVLWIEHKKLQPPQQKSNDHDTVNPIGEAGDPDLAAQRVQAHTPSAAQDNVLVIKDLRKVYKTPKGQPDKVAVHSLCLNIPAGSCFGLLGPNGAGKTTTMSMLTGTAWPTSGTATVASASVHGDVQEIYKRLGFCPQFHGLFPTLTVDEHLDFYGDLKGMPQVATAQFADVLTQALGMTEHRGKRSSQLSGGNKRKLSLAIAMMGAPEMLILDEPSAGVDPAARANIVEIIQAIKTQPGSRNCIVLTTHLMEEVEALCDRVAIMAHGQLRAVGSLPHIKSRFGEFWQVSIQRDGRSAEGAGDQLLEQLMQSLHPEAAVLERHHLSSTWRVPTAGGPKLAEAFRRLEGAKARLGIEQYAVTQCSLEQIFIKFAKDSEAEAAAAEAARAAEAANLS